MRTSLPFGLALVLVLAGLADARAQQHVATEVGLDLAQTPPAPLDVHEWGVWRLRAGRVDHLTDLLRETPAFVHRAGGGSGTLPVTPREPLEVALKPVVFLHADTPLDVSVTVEMPGGQPWLYYPDGVAGVTPAPANRTVSWSGRALPASAALPAAVSYVPATAGHWWNALRGAGASPFIPTGASHAERFLFYDGPIPFRMLWAPSGTSVAPVVARGLPASRLAWIINPNGAARLTVRGRRVVSTALFGVDPVRDELRAALRGAGLDAAETQSLLVTWDHDLFDRQLHAIWLVPQSEYDRMLPMTVTPRPRSITRVGVVIQML